MIGFNLSSPLPLTADTRVIAASVIAHPTLTSSLLLCFPPRSLLVFIPCIKDCSCISPMCLTSSFFQYFFFLSFFLCPIDLLFLIWVL